MTGDTTAAPRRERRDGAGVPLGAGAGAGAGRGGRPRSAWLPGSRGAMVAGTVVAAAVLSPPVEGWVRSSLTAHMTQHVLLAGLVAPLVALGSPAPARPLGAGVLAAGALAHTVLVVGWHVPVLFDAAEDRTAVHAGEHLTLIAGAWLLWWGAARAVHPARRGLGALAVFVAGLPLTLLGVGMTFAPAPWYEHHRDLTDQQLGGVVMWAGGGTLALVGGVALAVAWISAAGGGPR